MSVPFICHACGVEGFLGAHEGHQCEGTQELQQFTRVEFGKKREAFKELPDLGEGQLASPHCEHGQPMITCGLAHTVFYLTTQPASERKGKDLGGGFCQSCRRFIGGYHALMEHERQCGAQVQYRQQGTPPLTPQQQACLNGDHVRELDPVHASDGEDICAADTNGTQWPVYSCLHCRTLYVPMEA